MNVPWQLHVGESFSHALAQARRLAGASCATVQGLQTLKASKVLINNGYQLLDRRNKMQHYNIGLRLPIS
jgi:hypothetical protein